MYDNENGQGYGSPDNSNQWNQPNDGRAGINQPNQQQYYAPQTSRTYYSGENYSPFPNEGPLPTGPAYPNGPYQPNPPYNQGNDSSSRNSGLAIACLVLGILGFLSGVFFVGIALDVLAIILGIVSLIQNNRKKRPSYRRNGIGIPFHHTHLSCLLYHRHQPGSVGTGR